METIEHFAHISLVARVLGRERVLSRDEVMRLQGLRGSYGIASPAPICTDPAEAAAGDGPVRCQVVRAPETAAARLVDDRFGVSAGGDAEIRLTYRELTALIAEAVRQLT
jgi:L-fuculose-phosphate aldolase